MRGQGPLIVRHLASRARKRALSDLNYGHILTQRFRIRKGRAQDMRIPPCFLLALGT